MTDSQNWNDRYHQLITDIIQATLKGQIRSKEQVYRQLVQEVNSETAEVFQACLDQQVTDFQQQVETQTDELKKAKATRSLRALQTIVGEWQRAAQQNRTLDAIATASRQLMQADSAEYLTTLIRILDPNQPQAFNLAQVQQLAQTLKQQIQFISTPSRVNLVQETVLGINNGLAAWQKVQDHLVSWMYDRSGGALGFEGSPQQNSPWAVWGKQLNDSLAKSLFQALAKQESIVEIASRQSALEISQWIELILLMQCLQRGLVNWFDQLAYDAKVTAKISISTYLTFALIWSQLANGFNQATLLNSESRTAILNACFQMTLQILRAFSQRPYFPLYGGIFTLFTGEYLRSALHYLDEPLKQVEGTQEKARILTWLGSSFRSIGQHKVAISFHEKALDIARKAQDKVCEVANLNHLSRTYVAEKAYSQAIEYSQRALILSRQSGDKMGEANALANLGYSEVFQGKESPETEPEVYESAINFLEQGYRLSEQLGDGQSKSLCASSLGIAYIVCQQPELAIPYLEEGFKSAQASGDVSLQALNLVQLSEAYYQLNQSAKAILPGCLGMYLFWQIESPQWRQTAGILSIIQGQIGSEVFQQILAQSRPQLMSIIGFDGYEYISKLLAEYQAGESID